MSARQLRRAAERAQRKADRKAGFPSNAESSHPAPEEPRAASTTASEAQIEANRRNAQFSTGAQSPETKAKSAQNHTIHGLARHDQTNFKLLTTEDPAAFAALHQQLGDEHIPTSETETILIRTMAESEWLARRAQRLQDLFINPDTGLVTDERQFNLYKRYKTSHQREFHKCLADLLKLRREKRAEQIGFEAHRMKIDLHEIKKIRAEAEFSVKQIETQSKGVELTVQYMRAKNENPGFDEAFSTFFAKRQAA